MLDQPESMFARLAASLRDPWLETARPEQLPPAGDWLTWLILAGRGFGKTRAGSEWVRGLAEGASVSRIALVAATASDCRDVMVEGDSGLLSVCPDHFRPTYEPSKRRLTWPNGVIATMFSSEEPDRLRGPQHGAAWVDELGAWRNAQETWDMLQFGMRLGKRPRTLITTTPKPTKLLKDIIARVGPDVVITRGSTFDNRANLAPSFFSQIVSRYEGTRLGRQELNAELLSDTPGALWQMDWIDRDRVKEAPELARIVVAIDPAVSTNEGSDETGIVVVGKSQRRDGGAHLYVLEDLSGKYQPHEWARKAVEAFDRWKADRIIGEVNQGGQMIESTIRTIRSGLPYKAVHASRGKVTRAEPVSALYEQGKAHHVGAGLSRLEDQMCEFTSDFNRTGSGYSPDRVDALVWGCTELMPAHDNTLRVVPLHI